MIYLDYQASTPLASEARAAMLPWLDAEISVGNPHSSHAMGRRAAAAVEVARGQITATLGTNSGRLIFTSGATEAANLAIKGAADTAPPSRRHIVTVATEHACVLDSCAWLETRGWTVTRLGVGADGLVDVDEAASAIGPQTALVAVMLVNNEIGVIQPVRAIADAARQAGALFFCDAVQGFGRVTLPTDACDMVAMSAHKIFGPKGIGALWVSDGVTLAPLIHGGGQESGLRSGTLSPASCAGFGAAAVIAAERVETDARDVERLWALAQPLLADGWTLNGSSDQRWRGNLSIRRDGLDAARLISELRHIALSAGSACASGSGRPSHVLHALGLDDRQARSTLRIGFGRGTDPAAFAVALAEIDEAARRQGRVPA